jgi:hypothetical protein
LNDIDARSVPTYGGHYGEYRLAARSNWTRVRVNGTDQIYDTPFEAEAMAWREAKKAGFGVIRSSGASATNARSEAEKLFGAVFHKGRQVPVESV